MPDAIDLFIQTSVQFEFEPAPVSSLSTLGENCGLESCYCAPASLAAFAGNRGRQLRCLHSSFII